MPLAIANIVTVQRVFAQNKVPYLEKLHSIFQRLIMKLLFLFISLVLSKEIVLNDKIANLDQENPVLIQYIKENLLEPPPISPELINETVNNFRHYKGHESYSALVGQYGQPLFLEKLFGLLVSPDDQSQRFFIEAGAFDGVTGSNTLRFELDDRWTGLLVEPHPVSYEAAKSLQRNAWTIQTCFSITNHPDTIQFDAYESGGAVVNADQEERPCVVLDFPGGIDHSELLTMQCMPFYSIIEALGNPRIDFFSLDIDGVDLQVLYTIPWDKVNISVLMIETAALGDVFPGTIDEMLKYLNDKGYVFLKRLSIDDIFIKKTLMHQLVRNGSLSF